ncbi:uncharacterized protein [Dermacentor albipictus]|uniref:uncharacterized protein isoform X2 n=1 Tax=Dermacentor albipictus TaxID=60249 RepID=UPI0031FCFF0B
MGGSAEKAKRGFHDDVEQFFRDLALQRSGLPEEFTEKDAQQSQRKKQKESRELGYCAPACHLCGCLLHLVSQCKSDGDWGGYREDEASFRKF